MSEPTKRQLAKMPEFVLRYMAPMYGPGKPYAEELIRRRCLEGRQDYEKDLAANPTYHDGKPRPTWEQLSEIGRWSWERPKFTYQAKP